MNIASFVLYSVISLLSTLFIIKRFRTATPEQRPKMIGAACGAIAVAATMILLWAMR